MELLLTSTSSGEYLMKKLLRWKIGENENITPVIAFRKGGFYSVVPISFSSSKFNAPQDGKIVSIVKFFIYLLE